MPQGRKVSGQEVIEMIEHSNERWIATVDGYKEAHIVNVDGTETVWETFGTEKKFVEATKGKLAIQIAEEIAYLMALQVATAGDTEYLVENRKKLYDTLENLVDFPA